MDSVTGSSGERPGGRLRFAKVSERSCDRGGNLTGPWRNWQTCQPVKLVPREGRAGSNPAGLTPRLGRPTPLPLLASLWVLIRFEGVCYTQQCLTGWLPVPPRNPNGRGRREATAPVLFWLDLPFRPR